MSIKDLRNQLKKEISSMKITKNTIKDYSFVIFGVILQAFAMRLFLVPSFLVSGGVSGASQIINHLTNFPIGLMVLIGNIPLFFLGWRYLGGLRFALRTAVAIVLFSFFTDFLVLFIPSDGVTDDLVLNSIYGGLMYGIGLGVVYRGKGTSGGSDILGRILNHRFGISISTSYLITDSLVVLMGGLVFDWERALYGLAVIYVSGLAAEIAFEGRAIYRTAMIVTIQPEAVSERIMEGLDRGVTMLHGTGGYTHESRTVIYSVITQSEIPQLKEIVKDVDPLAFMVIGQAHEALGEGFRPLLEPKS
ncbi:MAG TPA: YitT family protein [Anaerolineaceae bacterium]|nr:YitT family protein [Anaerolineaceae bacterium]